jgi:hypothetical protein
MARLPTVGGDSGNWGTVLNEYLETAHNADGTLKLDVKTTADLKAIDVATLTDKQQALVAGYYAPGDQGGGVFYYDAGSGTASNGGTTLAPNAGGGRWKRAYSGPVNVKWFGAKGDGVTDDTAAIQAALNFVYTTGGGIVFFPLGQYGTTAPLLLKSTASDGGYSHPPVIMRGDGNTATAIIKSGTTTALSQDATVIVVKGSTGVRTDTWAAVGFENILIQNNSNAATTFAVHAYKGSRLIARYAKFACLEEVGDHNHYAFYCYDMWSSAFEDCTFVGDYGFFQSATGTSIRLVNCFAKTTKIAYQVRGTYNTLVNTCGDNCYGTFYKFMGSVSCTNLGAESPGCEVIIDCSNAHVVVDQATLWQPESDTGRFIKSSGSKIQIGQLRCYQAAGATRGYLWYEVANTQLLIEELAFAGSGNKFKYFDGDPSVSTDANAIRVFSSDMARTNGLVSVMPWRFDYWDWYVETPQYPLNNIHIGLLEPTVNSKGDSVAAAGGGTPDGFYLCSDFSTRPVLGWGRHNHSTSSLSAGSNWYVPFILSGTTANRPIWQTPGMSYFDTTLGKPIWWSGSAWVDAAGNIV